MSEEERQKNLKKTVMEMLRNRTNLNIISKWTKYTVEQILEICQKEDYSLYCKIACGQQLLDESFYKENENKKVR